MLRSGGRNNRSRSKARPGTVPLYTFLATTLHATGWLIIAAIVVAAAAGIRPSARMAQPFLAAGPTAPKPVPTAAE